MNTEDMSEYPDWKLKAIIAIASGEWKHSASPTEISRANKAKRILKNRKKDQLSHDER